jgi:hypothetical protein
VVVTVAGTGAVRCTSTVLRAAVLRAAVTCGLTLLAWLFGSAVANAATATSIPQVTSTGDSIQLDVSGLVNGLLGDLLSHHLPVRGGTSVTQPPADGGPAGTDSGSTSSSGGDYSSPPVLGSGSSGASGSSGNVWTGSTTVTAPVKPAPPVVPPAPPVAPPPVESHQPAVPPPPVVQHVDRQATPTEPSMSTPSSLPGEPQPPVEVPLQQPASQPVSSQSTGSTSHDLGNSTNGLSGTLPLGTGFRPTPGSTTDEHNAKRVSDGVPGLPSTSPD